MHIAHRPQRTVVDLYQNADARSCVVDFDVLARYMCFAIATGAVEVDDTDQIFVKNAPVKVAFFLCAHGCTQHSVEYELFAAVGKSNAFDFDTFHFA